MLIIFDHGTPAPLRSFLKEHTVKKTKDLGWDTLSNGELLRAAEEATFLAGRSPNPHPSIQIRSCGRNCAFCVDTAAAVLHAVADRFLVNIQSDVIHTLHGGSLLGCL
jgi:hypothetical protein